MKSNSVMEKYLIDRINLTATNHDNKSCPPFDGPPIKGHRWAMGFEGYYSVSKSGQVASYRMRGGYVMKQRLTSNGYLYVKFQGKNMRIHREVALAWIGLPEIGKYQIHHIDNNKQNNSVDNLMWVTPSENNLYKYVVQSVYHQLPLI